MKKSRFNKYVTFSTEPSMYIVMKKYTDKECLGISEFIRDAVNARLIKLGISTDKKEDKSQSMQAGDGFEKEPDNAESVVFKPDFEINSLKELIEGEESKPEVDVT